MLVLRYRYYSQLLSEYQFKATSKLQLLTSNHMLGPQLETKRYRIISNNAHTPDYKNKTETDY